MPRVNTVNKAAKDYPQQGIKKGDTYYWWKFRYGGKRMSKTYPRPSQLTQSDFLSTLYEITERIEDASAADFSSPEELETFRDEIVSDLETLRDEQSDKKDNMPEGLQEGPTGELLQGRYDSVDEMIDEFNGINFDDYDPDEDSDDDDTDDEDSSEEEETEDDKDKQPESLTEWLDDKLGELAGVSYNGE